MGLGKVRVVKILRPQGQAWSEDDSMRKVYKKKRRACALCKPHKMGWERRWKVREAARWWAMDDEVRRQSQ